MSQPYVGDIRKFAGNFAPAEWMFCQGQLLQIAVYDTLFNLIGTTYGGDGQATFALPDLRGRVPMHAGTGSSGITYQIGESAGTETVTLTTGQIPSHTHNPVASARGRSDKPGDKLWADSGTGKPYVASGGTTVPLHTEAIGTAGGSQPHDNMVPFLGVNYIISLFGLFPVPGGGASNESYLSQINIFSFNFAPGGYAQCNGQLLPISQNQALFSLLGIRYGGNGTTTFALPDLRGRVPLKEGVFAGYTLGSVGGAVNHTLTAAEMAAHSHAPMARSITPDTATPQNNSWASKTGFTPYGTSADAAMAAGLLTNAGGGQAHNNMAPYLILNFCIALQGIFPTVT